MYTSVNYLKNLEYFATVVLGHIAIATSPKSE